MTETAPPVAGPEAAPGEAGSPFVSTSRTAAGSSVGWSSWSSAAAIAGSRTRPPMVVRLTASW